MGDRKETNFQTYLEYSIVPICKKKKNETSQKVSRNMS